MRKLLRFSLLSLLCVFGVLTANASGETFDFTANDYGLTHIVSGSDNESKYQKDYDESIVLTGLDGVTLTMDRNGGNGFRYWETASGVTSFRAYNKSKFTIVAPSGKKISQIDIVAATASLDKLSATGFTYTSDKKSGTWTGSAASVEFSASGTSSMNSINVTLVADDGKKDAKVEISATKIKVGGTAEVTTDGPAVTLKTSDPAVASVSGTTITGVGGGTATITATWSAEGDYKEGSAEFSLTVEAPHAIEDGVFNFNGLQDYGSGLGSPKNTDEYGSDYETATTTWTAGNVTLQAKNRYRWFEATDGTRTLRLYKATVDEVEVLGALTISVPDGKAITSIKFAGKQTTDAFSASTGTVSGQEWTGSAQSVDLAYALSSGAIQLSSITVTYGDEGETPALAAPTIVVDKDEFEAGFPVTLSFTHPNYDDGVIIYYTTDGTEPTTTSSFSDDPNDEYLLYLNKTVTIKAIAVLGDQTSAVAEKTVTLKEASDDSVKLPYENTLLGTSIPEGFTTEGDADIWTYTSNYGVKATSGSKVEKEAYLISPFVDMTTASAPKMQFSHAGKFFGTPENEATLWAREKGGEWQQITIPTYFTNSNWTYVDAEVDLAAFAGKKVQFGFKYVSTTSNYGTWEIKNLKIQDGEIVITYQDETIESLSAKTAAIDNVNLKLNNAEVVYINAGSGTNDIYVREGENAILFYKSTLALSVGQTLTGDIKFNFSPYKNLPEVVEISGVTNLDDVTLGTVATTEPATISLDDLAAGKHVNDLVKVTGVTVEVETASGVAPEGLQLADTNTYYAVVGSTKVQLYDKYGLNLLTDALNGETVDVEGIVSVYNTSLQLNVTKVTTTTTGINGLETEADAQQNGAMYNVAGQRVSDNYRGIVIVNGKKLLKK